MSDLSPEQVPDGWSEVAEAYDDEFTPFTSKYARDAADLAGIADGTRVLDVAAGAGAFTLEAARRGATVLATDFAPGMVERLAKSVSAMGFGSKVTTKVMDGQDLDVADESFDVAASQFGLMLFPDRAAGFRELHRALVPRGRAIVTSWGPLDRLVFMSVTQEAFEKGIPDFKPSGEPPSWVSLSDPENCIREMKNAGFSRAHVISPAHVWILEDPGATFDRLSTVSPPLKHLFASLDASTVANVREAFFSALRTRMGDGPYGLTGEANITIGVK